MARAGRVLQHQIDRLGAVLSGACAVHCLAVPLSFALVPALTFALHAHQHPSHKWAIALLHLSRCEVPLSSAAVGLALASTWIGTRSHRRVVPMLLAWLGALMLGAALTWADLRDDPLAHGAAMFCGGACLMLAHVRNSAMLRSTGRHKGR